MNRLVVIAIAAAVAVIGALVGIKHYGDARYQAGRDEVQGRWNAQKLVDQARVIAEATTNAKETQRRLSAQKEQDDADEKEKAQLRLAAGRATAAADSMRSDLANFITAGRRAATSRAATEAEREAAYDATLRAMEELHRRTDSAAGRFAQAADDARRRGLSCEADYREVETKKSPE